MDPAVEYNMANSSAPEDEGAILLGASLRHRKGRVPNRLTDQEGQDPDGMPCLVHP